MGERSAAARDEIFDAPEDELYEPQDSLQEALLANARVHRAGSGHTRASLWAFMCECGHPSCNEVVSLTFASFEGLRRHGDAVLAPGHRLRSTFRCATCGYGISVAGAPPRCPMCGTSEWLPTDQPR